jgi:ligand-binding sensor domain-containing protein
MAYLKKTIVTEQKHEQDEVLKLLVARVEIDDDLKYLNRKEKEIGVKSDGSLWIGEVGGDGFIYLYPDELEALQTALTKAQQQAQGK